MAEARATLDPQSDPRSARATEPNGVAPQSNPRCDPVTAGPASDGTPAHVAIIMDGNHRWARQRHLPGAAGHRAGARNVRPVAEACVDAGVQVLTLFAFSTENWQRPKREVTLLMNLMRNVLENDIAELDGRGVRLRIIGDRERFAPDLRALMDRAESRTQGNQRMTLNIAANFGGRWDIVRAARELAREVAEGRLHWDQIDEAALGTRLSLGGLPEPDICIRTGGDSRISNFLLWDFAYTELFFTDRYWPEFSSNDLHNAVEWFRGRQRRYGARP
jgi:undecaprenyl diphosphate synthase